MESGTNPNVALKPPPLNSDQLNYLIWRYLQEAGYGDAAVKLQRDWKAEPENLPFAKHIKGQALVSLVQKGLRYHHLALTIDESGRASKTPSPSAFFFGPESGRPASPSSAKDLFYSQSEIQRASSPSSNIPSLSRKRDTESNGSLDPTVASAKRSRKTITTDRNGNGVRKTSTSASDVPVSMELDHMNGNFGISHNMRSPSLGDNMNDEGAVNGVGLDIRMDVDMEIMTPGGGAEPVLNEAQEVFQPLVHTLTNGESVGVQVAPAKVANLGPSTTILRLPDRLSVTKSVWRPVDGSSLTVAGDHFCGAWKCASSSFQDDETKINYQELIGHDESTSITAVAWEPNGGMLAIATYTDTDQAGQLRLYEGRELTLIENLPASERAIISLKWLPSAWKLIGIAPYDDQGPDQAVSSTVLVWDFSGMQFSVSPTPLAVPELLLDIDSVYHGGQVVICAAGGNAVYYFRANQELVVEKKWSSATTDGISWAFVRCMSQGGGGNALIVAASSDNPRIWLPDRDVMRINAHNAPITGLELRPRAFHNTDAGAVLDFATSSMDATIKVWRLDLESNSMEVIHRLSIEQEFPVMSLSYSPDGFCLAGASYGHVRIWNAEHGYSLMAAWEGSGDEWRGASLRDEDAMSAGGMSSINGDTGTLNADHSLAWNGDSKKLAFSLSSQVAIINFQR